MDSTSSRSTFGRFSATSLPSAAGVRRGRTRCQKRLQHRAQARRSRTIKVCRGAAREGTECRSVSVLNEVQQGCSRNRSARHCFLCGAAPFLNVAYATLGACDAWVGSRRAVARSVGNDARRNTLDRRSLCCEFLEAIGDPRSFCLANLLTPRG